MSAAICKWYLCQPPRIAATEGGMNMVDALIKEHQNGNVTVPESVFQQANGYADAIAELGEKLKAICMPHVP